MQNTPVTVNAVHIQDWMTLIRFIQKKNYGHFSRVHTSYIDTNNVKRNTTPPSLFFHTHAHTHTCAHAQIHTQAAEKHRRKGCECDFTYYPKNVKTISMFNFITDFIINLVTQPTAYEVYQKLGWSRSAYGLNTSWTICNDNILVNNFSRCKYFIICQVQSNHW